MAVTSWEVAEETVLGVDKRNMAEIRLEIIERKGDTG